MQERRRTWPLAFRSRQREARSYRDPDGANIPFKTAWLITPKSARPKTFNISYEIQGTIQALWQFDGDGPGRPQPQHTLGGCIRDRRPRLAGYGRWQTGSLHRHQRPTGLWATTALRACSWPATGWT